MTAEGRTDRAIKLTRMCLDMVTANTWAMVVMAAFKVTPEEIEETFLDILAYQAKTAPEDHKKEAES